MYPTILLLSRVVGTRREGDLGLGNFITTGDDPVTQLGKERDTPLVLLSLRDL